MRKVFLFLVIAAGAAAFVGFDVVGAGVRAARESVRSTLTSAVPLKTQLAEAQAQVDAYAENVIRGEVAADRLRETIAVTERDVVARRGGVERERGTLSALKDALVHRTTVTPAVLRTTDGYAGTVSGTTDLEREGMMRARRFQTAAAILERRERDLEALRGDYDRTVAAVADAKAAQSRLTEEVTVLRAEIQALEAREAVAQTRRAAGAAVDSSGYGEAESRLAAIRDRVREQNKRLEYYSLRADASREAETGESLVPGNAIEAIEAALSTPAR